ncbi:MAG: ABC transporter permease subunit [Bacilli bacterium]
MFKRELKINLKSFIIYTSILVIMLSLVGIMYPSIMKSNIDIDSMLKMFPKEILKVFNMDIISISSFFGWFATEGYLFILLLGGIYASILGGTILLKEQGDHTIDFLYSKPVTKNKIITSKLLCGVFYLILFNIFIGLTSLIVTSLVENINLKKWMFLTIAPLMLHLFLFFLSFLLSIFFKKTSKGIGTGISLVFIFYLLNTLGNLTKKINFLKYFSCFYYVDAREIIKNSIIKIDSIIFFTVTCFMLICLIYTVYNKKELGK